MKRAIAGAVAAFLGTLVAFVYIALIIAIESPVDWGPLLQVALAVAPFAAYFGALFGYR